MEARTDQVREMANRLFDLHGIKDWKFTFDNAKIRAGLCRFHLKHISISKHMVLNDTITLKQIENVLLHEIAHALVGHEAGHGTEWRNKAISIGCDGERYHTLMLTNPTGMKGCGCGHVFKIVYKNRKETKNKLCKKCDTEILYTGFKKV